MSTPFNFQEHNRIRKELKVIDFYSCKNNHACFYVMGYKNKIFMANDEQIVNELSDQSYIKEFYPDDHDGYRLVYDAELNECDCRGDHLQLSSLQVCSVKEFMSNFSQYDWINFLVSLELKIALGKKTKSTACIN